MLTFSELCRAFLAHSQSRASHRRYQQIVSQHFSQWDDFPTFGQIEEWHLSHATSPNASNKALSTLKAMFTWGMRRGHFAGPNPATGVKRHQVHSRERVMNTVEIALILNCLDMLYPKFAAVLTCLLTTGCRISELLHMKIEHLNMQSGAWYQPKTKNGIPHTTYLPTQARERLLRLKLKGPYYFEGIYDHPLSRTQVDKSWQKTRASMRLEDVRIHDFRRTLATHLYKATKDEYLVKRCINHVNPNITAVYVRYGFEEVKEALQAQANRFFALAPAVPRTIDLPLFPPLPPEAESRTWLQ